MVTGVQVTFDRDMRVGSFDPSDILSLVGPIGAVPGPFTIQAVPGSLRVFNIFFATPQRLSGSYTVTISPNIYSVVNSDPTRTTGDPVDANQNAGLVQLRGGSAANGTTTFTASNSTVTTIGPGQTIDVPITINTDFTISAPVTLTLNISFPNDPALSATLLVIDPNNSNNDVTIPLFSGVGAGTEHGELPQHDLRRPPRLPIQNASAPFSATYQVQPGLGPKGKTVTLSSLERPLGEGRVHPADRQLVVRTHRHGPAQQLVDLDGPAGAERRPGRAGRRPGDGQLPDLRDRPDRRAVEHDLDGGRPGRRSAMPRAQPRLRGRRSARSPSIPPTPRATRSTSPRPAAASGRRPTSSRPTRTGRPGSR